MLKTNDTDSFTILRYSSAKPFSNIQDLYSWSNERILNWLCIPSSSYIYKQDIQCYWRIRMILGALDLRQCGWSQKSWNIMKPCNLFAGQPIHSSSRLLGENYLTSARPLMRIGLTQSRENQPLWLWGAVVTCGLRVWNGLGSEYLGEYLAYCNLIGRVMKI